MNAKKCDRCGEYYIESSKCGFLHFTAGAPTAIFVGLRVEKDLCPSCYEEFKNWMYQKKEREK